MPKRSKPGSAVDITAMLSYRILMLSSTLARWAAREYLQRFDLKLPEWRILSVVGARGPVSPNEVSDIVSIDKAWVSRTVPSLVKRQLLRSDQDPNDQRRTLLMLTPKGVEVHQAMSRVSIGRQKKLLECLTPAEAEEFARLLGVLQEKAEAMLSSQDRKDAQD